MTNEDKRKYYDLNKVHISYGRWSDKSKCSKCDTKNDKYMVFIGGGQLSNLWGTCCEDCLHI